MSAKLGLRPPGDQIQFRPMWQIVITISMVCGIFIWIGLCDLKQRIADIAKPVDIIIEGTGFSADYSIYGVSLRRNEYSPTLSPSSISANYRWQFKNKFLRGLKILLSEDTLQKTSAINIIIDEKSYRYPIAVLTSTWETRAFVNWEKRKMIEFSSPPQIYYNQSRIPLVARIINWPGDFSATLYAVKYVVIYCILAIFTYFLMFCIFLYLRIGAKDSMAHRVLLFGGDNESGCKTRGNRVSETIWLVGGFIFVAGSIIALETRQPYFFTQDDNFQQFLPTILQSCRSVIDGVFPTWNPYQQMGAPSSNMSVYTLTYPLTYLSYFFARYVLQNEFLTIEIFAILHLVLGYFATWLLLRKVGFESFSATLGSLCYILSGYFLIVGRSWYYMIPTALWWPLLMFSLVAIKNSSVSLRWVGSTGLIIGLYFHSGNVQMWTYGMGFFMLGLLLLVFNKEISIKRSLLAFPAVLCGITIAAPLLFPLLKVMSTTFRVGGDGTFGIYEGLSAMLFPYPITSLPAGSFATWCNLHSELMGQMYYSGTLFTFLGFGATIAILEVFTFFRFDSYAKKVLGENIWLICAAVAFLLALGDRGIIWSLISTMPVFNKFSHPLKFLPFLNLLLILGGGTVLMRYLHNSKHRFLGKVSAVCIVLVLLAYHVTLPLPSFYTYSVLPYPALPPQLSKLLNDTDGHPNRIIPFPPNIRHKSNHIIFMEWNYSSIYSVHSLDGYDPLVETTPETINMMNKIKNDPLAAARAYGVRWLLIQDENAAYSPINRNVGLLELSADGLVVMQALLVNAEKRFSLPGASVWEMKQYSPMAFVNAEPPKALHSSFSGNGMNIDTAQLSETPSSITANVLWRPDMIVSDSSNRTLSTEPDEWGRIKINIPNRTNAVSLRYSPPWGKGFIMAIVLLLATLCSYYVIVLRLKAHKE